MSSLRKHQSNALRVVQQAKMIFSSSGRHTFVVEGIADFRLYRQWLVDAHARLVTLPPKNVSLAERLNFGQGERKCQRESGC